MPLRRILVSDLPSPSPRRGELLVWIGRTPPPVVGATVRTASEDEAVAVVAAGPAVVRVALREPLGFLQSLAGRERMTAAAA